MNSRALVGVVALSVTIPVTLLAGSFNIHLGKYKGPGVEYDGDGTVYYYRYEAWIAPLLSTFTVAVGLVLLLVALFLDRVPPRAS